MLGHLRDILRLSRQATVDINQCNRILAVSEAVLEYHVAAGMKRSIMQVQYNGVDIEADVDASPDRCLREELRIPRECRLAINIGQLGLRKGTKIFLESAALVSNEFPTWHWLVVGERNSTKQESVEYEVELRRVAQTAPLAGRVHFLGRRDDVPRLMRQSDLLVHAALQEPLGRVLLEGGAAGMAIVATDVGGTKEIFPDASMAAIVPANSATALASALRPLMLDSLSRTQMGGQARKRIVAAFDVANRGRELAKVYHDLVVC